MPDYHVEMNFCRRCGATLRLAEGVAYVCEQGHTIFLNASPAVGLVLLNDQDEVLLLERAIDPGKGLLDIPGGFCDGPESAEDALRREILDEVGLDEADYTKPGYLVSGSDPYDYGGETLPVCGIIFSARMASDKQPKAADDAASATWVKLHELNLDQVHFPSVRKGLKLIIDAARPT